MTREAWSMTQNELETSLFLLGWKVKDDPVFGEDDGVCWAKDSEEVWPQVLEYWTETGGLHSFTSIRSLYNFVITEVTNGSKGI